MKNSPPLPAILLALSLLLSCIPLGRAATVPAVEVINIGGRRELLVGSEIHLNRFNVQALLGDENPRPAGAGRGLAVVEFHGDGERQGAVPLCLRR